MKNFSRILICLLLCCFAFGLVACDRRTPKEKSFSYPASTDQVVGNGGMAVRKGNYIYFANGFKSITSEEVTQNASYLQSALMLTKLNNGELVLAETGSIDEDFYITFSSKLAGFECTDLFIAGDYLYFATQSQGNEGGESAKNAGKVWAKEIVEFYSVKLDKTTAPKLLYQTTSTYSNIAFKYYLNGKALNLLVYEKTSNKLVKVDSNGRINEIASAKDVIFGEDAVFYVKNDTTNGTYSLYRFDIALNSSTLLETRDADFTLVGASENYVFATINRTVNARSTSYKDLYRCNAQTGTFSLIAQNVGDYELHIAQDGTVVAIDDNFIDLYVNNADYSPSETITDEDADEIKFIGLVNGSVVYYVKNDSKYTIKMVSFYNALHNDNAEIVVKAEDIENLNIDQFDLEEEFLYFYKKIGEHEYLCRIKLNSTVVETEEFVGVYLTADIPAKTEETED